MVDNTKFVNCFNPHLRVGGDIDHRQMQSLLIVSIHTSAWEVTGSAAPVAAAKSSFNPHLRVGGDLTFCHLVFLWPVSIHTSAWEVT